MLKKTGKHPLGVRVNVTVDLEHFLPYRIHKLWVRTALPRSVKVKSGAVIKARAWRVLLILATHGPLTNTQIAGLTFMDAGSTTRAINDLLAHTLIISRTHTSDRRKQVVTLSAEGAAAYGEIAPLRLEFSEELLSVLNAKERTALFQILHKLDEHLEQRAQEDGDPFTDDYEE